MTFRVAFYRGTRPGIAGAYNWFVRKWEAGDYSHAELIFSDGISASASFADKGVRFKQIDYSADRWDFIELPAHLEPGARRYFERHNGEGYDLIGNVHFMVGFIHHAKNKKFCSEAIAEALGIKDGWRFGPNALYPIVMAMVEAYRVAPLQISQH
jgi:hypothetical protein